MTKKSDVNTKILIYTHEFTPYNGGIATYNVELVQGLSAYGYDIMVIAPNYGQGELDDKGKGYRVWRPFSHKGFKPYKILTSIVSLIIAWLKFRPSVVLATNKGAHRCLALISLLVPLPYILVIHGSEVAEHFEGNKFMKLALHRMFLLAKAIIVVSHSTKSVIASYIPEVISKTHIVYHGIQDMGLMDHQNHSIQALWTRLKLHTEDKIILTVARIIPEKGQDQVILALPQILKEVPNAKYLLIGGGEFDNSLKSLAEQTGVSHAVFFLGDVPRDKIWSFYEACDVFVMPSRRGVKESFGIVFLEAAAFGKPAIAGDHGGMKEVIIDGKTGLLVEPTHTGEIARAVIRLLTDVEFSNQLGQEARKHFKNCFSIETMIERTVNVIESVER